MMQRVIKHPAGAFDACVGCRAEPAHIATKGTHGTEPVRFAPCDRHMLECCRCGRRTAKHDTLEQARAEWAAQHAARLPRAIAARPRAVA